MGFYSLSVERFHIDNTRSRHEDTDTVAVVLRVGNRAQMSKTMYAGDVNNGDHGVNLVFDPVLVGNLDTPVVMAYQIYNGDTGKLSVGLPDIGNDLGQRAIDAIDQAPEQAGPLDYTQWPASGGPEDPDGADPPDFEDGSWIKVLEFAFLGSLLFPDCDGFVAIGTIGLRRRDWDAQIAAAGGTYRRTIRYPGYDSPAGCGSNSDYTVTWSVTRHPPGGPSVRQFLRDHQLSLRPGLRSLDATNTPISMRALMT
jgi:hypothetical protein